MRDKTEAAQKPRMTGRDRAGHAGLFVFSPVSIWASAGHSCIRRLPGHTSESLFDTTA